MNFLLIFLLMTLASYAHDETVTTTKSLETIMSSLTNHLKRNTVLKNESFRTDRCEKNKVVWTDVLMGKKIENIQYHFQEGCDLQGVVEPKIFQEFPLKLSLRNLPFSLLESQNIIHAKIELNPILDVQMRRGHLTGNQLSVYFEADYQIRIKTIHSKIITEYIGGEIRINQINKKKVKIRKKIN